MKYMFHCLNAFCYARRPQHLMVHCQHCFNCSWLKSHCIINTSWWGFKPHKTRITVIRVMGFCTMMQWSAMSFWSPCAWWVHASVAALINGSFYPSAPNVANIGVSLATCVNQATKVYVTACQNLCRLTACKVWGNLICCKSANNRWKPEMLGVNSSKTAFFFLTWHKLSK